MVLYSCATSPSSPSSLSSASRPSNASSASSPSSTSSRSSPRSPSSPSSPRSASSASSPSSPRSASSPSSPSSPSSTSSPSSPSSPSSWRELYALYLRCPNTPQSRDFYCRRCVALRARHQKYPPAGARGVFHDPKDRVFRLPLFLRRPLTALHSRRLPHASGHTRRLRSSWRTSLGRGERCGGKQDPDLTLL
jgi:hypothetical protein